MQLIPAVVFVLQHYAGKHWASSSRTWCHELWRQTGRPVLRRRESRCSDDFYCSRLLWVVISVLRSSL